MKRLIDYHLKIWRADKQRKPLIIRGARQVGKTHSVREFGRGFKNLVEINFEKNNQAGQLFEGSLEPQKLLRNLSLLTRQDIVPEHTLLFFDEIQAAPRVLTALRYFYEDLPELHIVAAGSLLEFAIEQVGVPVGRVSFLDSHQNSSYGVRFSKQNYSVYQKIHSIPLYAIASLFLENKDAVDGLF